jgi:hypothetical protein
MAVNQERNEGTKRDRERERARETNAGRALL